MPKNHAQKPTGQPTITNTQTHCVSLVSLFFLIDSNRKIITTDLNFNQAKAISERISRSIIKVQSMAEVVSCCSMDYVGHLRSVIRAVKELSSKKENIDLIKELSALGVYLADDYHNIIDCQREDFEEIRSNLEKGDSHEQ